MIKRVTILLALLSFYCSTNAQLRNSKWCFGDSVGIDFINPQNPQVFSTAGFCRGSSASIADSLGNLQLYSHTKYYHPWTQQCDKYTVVYNFADTVIGNGDCITGSGWYQELIFLPVFNKSKFFLFCADATSDKNGLVYSLINGNINNGGGGVTKKDKRVNNYKQVDCVNAVKHGNGRDWWVFSRRFDKTLNGFNFWDIYLVNDTGVVDSVIQQVGTASKQSLARTAISKDGKRIAFVNAWNLVEVYDFDRCTGIISNPITIVGQLSNNIDVWLGVAFSPNGKVLYLSNWGTKSLVQYDLTAANIAASKFVVYTDTTPGVQYGGLALAPDDKIYHTWWGCTHLGVINNPDSLSKQCNYAPNSFYLGGKHSNMSLPNNPNYELGPDTGSVCDSLGLGFASSASNSKSIMHVAPNPIYKNLLRIQCTLQSNYISQLEIIEVCGVVIFQEEYSPSNEWQTIQLPQLKNGIYLCKISNGAESICSKFVVIK